MVLLLSAMEGLRRAVFDVVRPAWERGKPDLTRTIRLCRAVGCDRWTVEVDGGEASAPFPLEEYTFGFDSFGRRTVSCPGAQHG